MGIMSMIRNKKKTFRRAKLARKELAIDKLKKQKTEQTEEAKINKEKAELENQVGNLKKQNRKGGNLASFAKGAAKVMNKAKKGMDNNAGTYSFGSKDVFSEGSKDVFTPGSSGPFSQPTKAKPKESNITINIKK